MKLQSTTLFTAKSKCRTKFEVHACEWNPRMELLALASRKGEVVVKRSQWKTGWKRDFAKESLFLSRWEALFLPRLHQRTTKEDIVQTICWCPDGQILLVAFDSGRLYYVDAQSGRPLYAKWVECGQSTCLKWFSLDGRVCKEVSMDGGCRDSRRVGVKGWNEAVRPSSQDLLSPSGESSNKEGGTR